METDDELTKIVHQLRERADWVSTLVRPPGTATGDETPSDRWRLERHTTVEQLCEGAGHLLGAAERLQGWLDEHGPEDLKNPYRGDRWYAYAPLRGGPRSRRPWLPSWGRLRRLAIPRR